MFCSTVSHHEPRHDAVFVPVYIHDKNDLSRGKCSATVRLSIYIYIYYIYMSISMYIYIHVWTGY